MAPAAPPKEASPPNSSEAVTPNRYLQRLQLARHHRRQREMATAGNAPLPNENNKIPDESPIPQPKRGLRRTRSETNLDVESSEAKRQRLDEGTVLEARDKRIAELEEQVAALTAERDRLTGGADSSNEEDAATNQPGTILVTRPVLSITAPRLPEQYKPWLGPWEDGPRLSAEKERRLLFPTIDELAQFESNLGTLQLDGDFGYRVRWTLERWRTMIFSSFAYLCRLEASRLECRYAVTYSASHALSDKCPERGPKEWRDWLAVQGAILTPSSANLEILRSNPEFQELRRIAQTEPQDMGLVLRQTQGYNPQLVRLIEEHRDQFMQLLNEEAAPVPSAPAARSTAVQQSPPNNATGDERLAAQTVTPAADDRPDEMLGFGASFDEYNSTSAPVTSVGEGAAAGGAASLESLRSIPQFQQLRQIVRTQPQMLEPFLQQIATGNPLLSQLIQDHRDHFMRMLGEGADNDAPAVSTPAAGSTAEQQAHPVSTTGTGAQPRTSEMVSGFNVSTLAQLNGQTVPAAPAAGSTALQQAASALTNGNNQFSSNGPKGRAVTGGVEVRIPPPQATEPPGTAAARDNNTVSLTASSESVGDEPSTVPESSSRARGRPRGRGTGRGRGRGSRRGGRRAR